MRKKEIFGHIDHTLLNPCATWVEIQELCEEAIRYQTASVCIPPSYVKRVRERYSNLCICTVIGFPLGYSTAESKKAEIIEAVASGADELDVVINLGDVKNGDFNKITKELADLRQTTDKRILKVIVETCYLTTKEKEELCKCITESGADFIKTSTGFGNGGATLEDIELFKKFIGSDVKIKASGGVRTCKDFEAFLAAGCDRIGASSAVKVLNDQEL